MKRVFEYLKEHFPLNVLYLGTIDTSRDAFRFIASTTDGSQVNEEFIRIPRKLWELGLNVRTPFTMSASDTDPDIRAIAPYFRLEGNTAHALPLWIENVRAIAPYFRLEGNTALVLPLWIENERIGFMGLHANGENMYTTNHVELIGVVAKPVAIALANAMDYKAILQERDILIDDKRFLNREIFGNAGDEIIGGNSGLRNVMEMVQQVATKKTSVLLLGETGTGKEVIASAIHFTSPRKDGPFIKVNCGAIPENLIDSELFGHEKGAFTGAFAEKRGRFERANGGTLFLDEIGELPLQSQVRLLRVLQNRQINRVGGEKLIPVDVRIIAATNRNLKEMISEGRFREDLWYRLNVFPINVPPLRDRKEDIPALVRHFVMQKSHELGITVPPLIIPDALEKLMNYGWPGNVRELENLVERELICHRGGQLKFDCLYPDGKVCEIAPIQEATADVASSLDDAMRLHISKALKTTKGKINGPGGAAELLGIIPNTLRGRMRKLGIDLPPGN